MAKGDAPALRMRLEQNRLVPDSAYDQERLSTYRNGSVIHVTLWQKRNEKLLRKYWAILHRAVADCPTPWENAEEASDALKMALGITDIGHSVNGQRFLRPGSISLASMDEAAFSDFYERAMAVLARVTGVDPETLSAESADVGDDPDHEPASHSVSPGSDVAGSGDLTAPEDTAAELPADAVDTGAGDIEEEHEAASSPAPEQRDEASWIIDFAKRMFSAIGPEEEVVVNLSKALFVDGLSQDARERARAITNYCRALCRGEIERDDAMDIIAGKARCEAKELTGGAS